jgi:hypothetical protein
MARLLYCWRCQMDIPMLEDHEAEYVLGPMYRSRGRNFHGARLEGLKRYQELTNFPETNINAVWHHIIRQYGPPCSVCGKPLRTPRAKMCAACGAEVAQTPTETTGTKK